MGTVGELFHTNHQTALHNGSNQSLARHFSYRNSGQADRSIELAQQESATRVLVSPFCYAGILHVYRPQLQKNEVPTTSKDQRD